MLFKTLQTSALVGTVSLLVLLVVHLELFMEETKNPTVFMIFVPVALMIAMFGQIIRVFRKKVYYDWERTTLVYVSLSAFLALFCLVFYLGYTKPRTPDGSVFIFHRLFFLTAGLVIITVAEWVGYFLIGIPKAMRGYVVVPPERLRNPEQKDAAESVIKGEVNHGSAG